MFREENRKPGDLEFSVGDSGKGRTAGPRVEPTEGWHGVWLVSQVDRCYNLDRGPRMGLGHGTATDGPMVICVNVSSENSRFLIVSCSNPAGYARVV